MTTAGASASPHSKGGVSAVLSHRARNVVDDDPLTALLRSLDYFPTQPWAARAMAELVLRIDPSARSAWESACGEGIMGYGMADYFERVVMSDAHDYRIGAPVIDFRSPDAEAPGGPVDWVFTNPPFGHAKTFVTLARKRARRGVAMFVRLGFQETIGRFELFSGPMRAALACPFAERVGIKLGDCVIGGGTAAAYMVAIWLTDPALASDYPDDTLLRPIPPGTRDRLSRASDGRFLAGLRSSRRARLMPVS